MITNELIDNLNIPDFQCTVLYLLHNLRWLGEIVNTSKFEPSLEGGWTESFEEKTKSNQETKLL